MGRRHKTTCLLKDVINKHLWVLDPTEPMPDPPFGARLTVMWNDDVRGATDEEIRRSFEPCNPWIPIRPGCEMPLDARSVLVSFRCFTEDGFEKNGHEVRLGHFEDAPKPQWYAYGVGGRAKAYKLSVEDIEAWQPLPEAYWPEEEW